MAVSYYDCQIDGGFQREHTVMDSEYCPWCRISELETAITEYATVWLDNDLDDSTWEIEVEKTREVLIDIAKRQLMEK